MAGGQSWTNISRMTAWAVMPQLQLLSNGILVLTSGRPGLHLWARPTARGIADDGQWTVFDLAGEHNARVADQRWTFHGHMLNASCTGSSAAACGHGLTTCTVCTSADATPQSTAYTGLAELKASRHAMGTSMSLSRSSPGAVSRVLVVYDRLANGWGEPPGPWGAADAIFSMAVSLWSNF
eukprot:SAG31_NODE_5392_length_2565_cov_6.687753_2_plen_181_part_00